MNNVSIPVMLIVLGYITINDPKTNPIIKLYVVE